MINTIFMIMLSAQCDVYNESLSYSVKQQCIQEIMTCVSGYPPVSGIDEILNNLEECLDKANNKKEVK